MDNTLQYTLVYLVAARARFVPGVVEPEHEFHQRQVNKTQYQRDIQDQ